MSERYLWKFKWDCGRNGNLEGIFTATEEDIQGIIGKKVDFGEAFGKHSEVYGTIEEGEIKKVDLDCETVLKVEVVLRDTWSGYNPFEYLSEEEEEGEES